MAENQKYKNNQELYNKRLKKQNLHEKLDFKKLEPYKIMKWIGRVNYKLQLPKKMRIHPIFHVSLLEKALLHAREMPMEINEEQEYEVEQILDHQKISRKLHYLVKWKWYDILKNMWEPTENLKNT
ncbi:uncharacterized protein CIMG_12581 [Coccidioides immitis RS]|uniref:Chromo domain-containing protein n=1 Tax=Coccidioides immitis (strain RS) TaxID=246410 RepID=J3K040_COCIM|nr:uncharacterized protein CIMG_12581 [Coccidioides immitis RS]EAS27179.3 hypothetical protein CIMG_12581 [Coccidioides immitis RS]